MALPLFGAVAVVAQPATQPAPPAAGMNAPVAMEFPAEGIELKTLVDIVMKRLRTPILYDETILNKRIIVRVPINVPESALVDILQSALKMKQMALIDAEIPGWKQIVPVSNLAAVAKPLAPGEKAEPGVAVTQVLTAKHTDPARFVEAIRPLLTTPGGNLQVLQGQKILIVTDYPTVLKRIGEMFALLDTEGPPVEVKFIALKQAEASTVAPIATALATARDGPAAAGTGGGVVITADDRVNQVIVVAPPERRRCSCARSSPHRSRISRRFVPTCRRASAQCCRAPGPCGRPTASTR